MAIKTSRIPKKGSISNIRIKPLEVSLYQTYIEVGVLAYRQHYLHLWEDQNPDPYINISFTLEVLRNEALNGNTKLFLIYKDALAIGILKINLDHDLGHHPSKEVLLLDKIYIMKAYSGQGVGKNVLDFVEKLARSSNKKMIALDTMKHGPALDFYKKNGFKIFEEIQLGFSTVKDDQRGMYVMFKTL
jgi:GNAT superfamily N-acetyltransferase